MIYQIITLLVLIAAVSSLTEADYEKSNGLNQQGLYETLAAPDSAIKLQQDDAAPQRSIRLRPSRPRSFVPLLADRGNCPNGPSLDITCDPKRPWPACPPQSYCYATSSVENSLYWCCPV